MKKIILAALVLVAPLSLQAADFGLVTNQYASLGNSETEDAAFEYRGELVPRFSFLIGDGGSFFISAGLSLNYKDELYFVPELLRTELSLRSGAWGIRAGRISYADPLTFIAEGLFDGVQASHSSSFGKFSLGAWYTGLLYKENIKITMTAQDYELYSAALDYSDFANTYFAPSRLLTSLDWEHLSFANLMRIKAALTAQIDLTDNKEKYHSQYLTIKLGIPVSSFLIELGGSLGLAQAQTASGSDDINLTLAGDAGFFYTLPTDFHSRISFNAKYASGEFNDTLGAFVPVTSKYYGQIFQPGMTALSVFGLNYSARLSQTLGASMSASYFVRNDDITYNTFNMNSEEKAGSFLLGGEFFARVIWSPFSDLQLNFGAGAFIPAMGDVWPDAKPKWRAELSAILAIF